MIIYVTIKEGSIIEEGKCKIQNVLKSHNYNSNYLGEYKSRDYSTLVIDVDNLITNDDYITVKEELAKSCEIFEIDNFMKYYYLIKYGHNPKVVNDLVRKRLIRSLFTYETYNSHSQEGIFYVGLKISEMNPFDNIKSEELKNLVENTEGVLKLIKY